MNGRATVLLLAFVAAAGCGGGPPDGYVVFRDAYDPLVRNAPVRTVVVAPGIGAVVFERAVVVNPEGPPDLVAAAPVSEEEWAALAAPLSLAAGLPEDVPFTSAAPVLVQFSGRVGEVHVSLVRESEKILDRPIREAREILDRIAARTAAADPVATAGKLLDHEAEAVRGIGREILERIAKDESRPVEERRAAGRALAEHDAAGAVRRFEEYEPR